MLVLAGGGGGSAGATASTAGGGSSSARTPKGMVQAAAAATHCRRETPSDRADAWEASARAARRLQRRHICEEIRGVTSYCVTVSSLARSTADSVKARPSFTRPPRHPKTPCSGPDRIMPVPVLALVPLAFSLWGSRALLPAGDGSCACGAHGICRDGQCHCDEGWTGHDCATSTCPSSATATATALQDHACVIRGIRDRRASISKWTPP